MAVWTMDVSTIVFSRIVEDFSDVLKSQYQMKKVSVGGFATWLNFSTSQVSESPPLFPYITVIELAGAEKAQDLEGTSLNGGLFTFQIDVFDNQSESRVKNCMAEIIKIMKSMRFGIPATASFDSKSQEYRMVARFQRVICAGDVL